MDPVCVRFVADFQAGAELQDLCSAGGEAVEWLA